VHDGARLLVSFEQPHRALEQVLEIHQALGRLAPLVLPEDAEHEVGRDRRLAVAEPAVVGVGREAPVLRPLDLGREVARRPEAERARQRVADPAQEERLRGKDPPLIAFEVAQQRERRRVERRGADTLDAERTQPRAQLACRLVGERDSQDVPRRERAARDLPGDPARDRRRLPRPRAGENAQRPARTLDGGALLGVQPLEDLLGVQGAEASGATGRGPSRERHSFTRRRSRELR
jgi:hypothetical protein